MQTLTKNVLKPLTNEDLKPLIGEQGDTCVSFYLSTARAGKDTLQNPTHLKNLTRVARSRLSELGMEERPMEEFLEPLNEIKDDYPFWQHQKDGLGLFLSHDLFYYVRIPYPVDDLAVVSNAFHLKPLLPLLSDNTLFYVLSLNRKAVEFFRASRFEIEPVEVEEMPRSIDEMLAVETVTKGYQLHSVARGILGQKTAIRHGEAPDMELVKKQLLRFFQMVDRALNTRLNNEKAPLIVAGVDYYHPIYRQANSYAHLFPQGIVGNPELMSAGEIKAAAWKVMEPHFEKKREEAAAAINNGLAKKQATTDLETAVAAAHHGRVATCFVALGEKLWGTFNETTAKVELLDAPHHCAKDLLDDAAGHTLLHDGIVYPVTRDMVPGGGLIAALLRY